MLTVLRPMSITTGNMSSNSANSSYIKKPQIKIWCLTLKSRRSRSTSFETSCKPRKTNSALKTVSVITCTKSYRMRRRNYKHNRKLLRKPVKKMPWYKTYSSNHKNKTLRLRKAKVKNRLMICSTTSSWNSLVYRQSKNSKIKSPKWRTSNWRRLQSWRNLSEMRGGPTKQTASW